MKQRIHDYLVQRPAGATPDELLELVFTAPGSDPALGERLLHTLLADDPRFLRRPDGRWAVAAHETLARPIDEATFVVLDLETTGVSSGAAGIMEIGAVRVLGGRVVGELSQLVNPNVKIPPYVAKLTGIDERLLAAEPPIREAWPRIAEFIGDSVIVAHNAGYDVGFLDAAATVFSGAPLPNPRICSLRLARRLLPGLQRSGIDALAAEFGIPVADRHRALGDARVTTEIFFHLVEKLKEQGIVRVDDALEFQNHAGDGRPFVCLLPREKLSSLPAAPGIYRFVDENGELLYVGRAKNLRERIWSYTANSAAHGNKTLEVIRRSRDVRVEVLGSELEAALEEAAAIRREKPPYNLLGKHLPQIAFIRLGLHDDFPRLSISRRMSGKARFAGPFRNRKEADRAVATITRLFQLRTCPGKLQPDPAFTPCDQGRIGACTAPCAERVSPERYGEQVARYLTMLDGDTSAIDDALARNRTIAHTEAGAHLYRGLHQLRRIVRRHSKLRRIVGSGCFLVLQKAEGGNMVLAYAVIHGLLAVRGRLLDESQVGKLADEIRGQLKRSKQEGRVEEAVDGTTILAAWLRDRPENDGNIFAIEGDDVGEEAESDWRAACAELLRS